MSAPKEVLLKACGAVGLAEQEGSVVAEGAELPHNGQKGVNSVGVLIEHVTGYDEVEGALCCTLLHNAIRKPT